MAGLDSAKLLASRPCAQRDERSWEEREMVKAAMFLVCAITSAIAATGALAYVHPTDCLFAIHGVQGLVGNVWANDTPGEPPSGDRGSGQFSDVFTQGGITAPEAQADDSSWGLPDDNAESGGGDALKEGEAFHRVDVVGTWTFDHKVRQQWIVLIETQAFTMSSGTSAAYARARAFIRDDRSGCTAVEIKERSGGHRVLCPGVPEGILPDDGRIRRGRHGRSSDQDLRDRCRTGSRPCLCGVDRPCSRE